MIKLIDNYYIDADNYQYILMNKILRTKKADQSTYLADIIVGYYGDIPSLIKGCMDNYLKEHVKNEDICTLVAYRESVLDLYQKIDKMIEGIDIDTVIKNYKLSEKG